MTLPHKALSVKSNGGLRVSVSGPSFARLERFNAGRSEPLHYIRNPQV